MTAVLELADVVVRYPGAQQVEALQGVSLTITAGELLAIVGPSGSGKTTLLHVAGTLERTTLGRVRVEGHEVSGLSDRQLAGLRAWRIGFIFQQFFLIEALTAVDNVATGLLYRGLAPRARRVAAEAALHRVGLGHRLNQRVSSLSGGERQRVAIARAVVGQPAIVLADEPTGNLDSATSRTVIELLTELNRDGTTMAIVTHNPEIAAAMPRQVRISDGRIVSDELSQ
jgi:putative ABC transport system ATP-binding protein